MKAFLNMFDLPYAWLEFWFLRRSLAI